MEYQKLCLEPKTHIFSISDPKISDLIDWDGPLTEPPLTIGIPLDELQLQAELGDFLVFPDIPCHAQQIENTVPKVTTKGEWQVEIF